MGLARTVSLCAYLAAAISFVLYGIGLFGIGVRGNYIVQLDKGDTELRLGFLGVCLSGGGLSDRHCSQIVKLGDEDAGTGDVLEHLKDDMDLEKEGMPTDADSLIEMARTLRNNAFPGYDLIVAFSFLPIGSFLSFFPLFFNHPKRRKVCAMLLMATALCLGGGICAAFAALFGTVRSQAVLSQLSKENNGISIKDGTLLRKIFIGAVAMNFLFTLFVAIIGYTQSGARQAKGQNAKYNNGLMPAGKQKKKGKYTIVPMARRR